MSPLPFVAKLFETVIYICLYFLSTHSFLNSHRSCFCSYYSARTTLMMSSMPNLALLCQSSGQSPLLILSNLSAACYSWLHLLITLFLLASWNMRPSWFSLYFCGLLDDFADSPNVPCFLMLLCPRVQLPGLFIFSVLSVGNRIQVRAFKHHVYTVNSRMISAVSTHLCLHA